MIEACEFVVRLSKAMSVPERPKLGEILAVSAIVVGITHCHLLQLRLCYCHLVVSYVSAFARYQPGVLDTRQDSRDQEGKRLG